MRLYHTSAAVLEKLCLTTLKIELDLADLLRAGGYHGATHLPEKSGFGDARRRLRMAAACAR